MQKTIQSIKVTLILLTAIINNPSSLFAQLNTNPDKFTPKEFSIPPAPVFDLMNVTPSQVNRTSDIKDFKVDWSFKSWKLSPNLAIQSQPVWELIYNRRDLSKYQNASPFMRRLASLDISMGTVQDENNDRRIGFAGKMKVWTQSDPLLQRQLYTGIAEKYAEEKKNLEMQINELEKKLDTTANYLEKPGLRSLLESLKQQYYTINSRRNQEINEKALVYVQEHWNASSVDIAFGKVFSYRTDTVGKITGLRLDRNTGLAAWINANIGLGKRWMMSGLVRTSWYEEQLDFSLTDTLTQEQSQQSAVARNRLYSVGLNVRYGSPVYTLFLEILYERKALKTALEALQDVFTMPENSVITGGTTVKWGQVLPNTLTLGGDWRVSRVLALNYGMRCVFDKNWKFTTFTPLVTLSCMMR